VGRMRRAVSRPESERARSRPDSSTPFASSSTKSGIPPERTARRSTTSPGSASPAAAATSSFAWRRPRRPSAIGSRCARAGQGGSKSGRKVSRSSTPAVAHCSRSRQREQRGEERHGLGRLQAHPGEPALEPLELLLGRGLVPEAQALLDQLDHGVERAVLRVGRAAALEPAVRRLRLAQPLAQVVVHQPTSRSPPPPRSRPPGPGAPAPARSGRAGARAPARARSAKGRGAGARSGASGSSSRAIVSSASRSASTGTSRFSAWRAVTVSMSSPSRWPRSHSGISTTPPPARSRAAAPGSAKGCRPVRHSSRISPQA
jgi:hypothetical protein